MHAAIVNQDDWCCWSLNQLSRAFGLARETVSKRLIDDGVSPAYDRNGHPVYRVKDAAQAILINSVRQSGVIEDPDTLSPKEQSDYWRGKNEKRKYFNDTGILVSAEDARLQMAEIVKSGLNVLETLPDILERDFDLEPEIIANVQGKIFELRNLWAENIEK